MKLLENTGAVVSLMLVAAGGFQLWKSGFTASGLLGFAGGSVAAFALSITLYVFQLRNRIAMLENASRGSEPR